MADHEPDAPSTEENLTMSTTAVTPLEDTDALDLPIEAPVVVGSWGEDEPTDASWSEDKTIPDPRRRDD